MFPVDSPLQAHSRQGGYFLPYDIIALYKTPSPPAKHATALPAADKANAKISATSQKNPRGIYHIRHDCCLALLQKYRPDRETQAREHALCSRIDALKREFVERDGNYSQVRHCSNFYFFQCNFPASLRCP